MPWTRTAISPEPSHTTSQVALFVSVRSIRSATTMVQRKGDINRVHNSRYQSMSTKTGECECVMSCKNFFRLLIFSLHCHRDQETSKFHNSGHDTYKHVVLALCWNRHSIQIPHRGSLSSLKLQSNITIGSSKLYKSTSTPFCTVAPSDNNCTPVDGCSIWHSFSELYHLSRCLIILISREHSSSFFLSFLSNRSLFVPYAAVSCRSIKGYDLFQASSHFNRCSSGHLPSLLHNAFLPCSRRIYRSSRCSYSRSSHSSPTSGEV
jgi:hypothetical protein